MTKGKPGMMSYPSCPALIFVQYSVLSRVRPKEVLLLNDTFRIDFSLYVMCVQQLMSKMSVGFA